MYKTHHKPQVAAYDAIKLGSIVWGKKPVTSKLKKRSHKPNTKMIVVERIITGRFKLSYIENETTKYVWRDGAQLFNTGRVIESVLLVMQRLIFKYSFNIFKIFIYLNA